MCGEEEPPTARQPPASRLASPLSPRRTYRGCDRNRNRAERRPKRHTGGRGTRCDHRGSGHRLGGRGGRRHWFRSQSISDCSGWRSGECG